MQIIRSVPLIIIYIQFPEYYSMGTKRAYPPTYFMAFLIAAIVLHFSFPLFQLVYFPVSMLGAVPVLFGIWMNIWADSLFKREGTTVKPDESPSKLVTGGPFRISRHPMYLGMASILLGEAVILGSVVAFAFPILFVYVIEARFIPAEEASLEKAFGSSFREYRKSARRWL
jgi:protein-S-isoprenylcysteine O-methyltransferase Ste14